MTNSVAGINHRITSLVFVLLCLSGDPAGAGQQTGLLIALKGRDLTLGGSAYLVSFAIQKQSHWGDPNQGMVSLDCRAAQNNAGTFVMKMSFQYEKEPVFAPPGSRGYGPMDYHEGNLIVWRKMEKYVLSSPERNVAIEKLKVFFIDPNNRVVRTGENTLVHRLPVGSDDHAFEFRQFQFAAGWGYSKHLARSVSTEQVDGFVRMTAEGSYGTGSEGTWDLSVDPNSEYIVRRASYRMRGMDKPSIITRNTGVLSNDNITIAKYGTYEGSRGVKLSVEATDITREPSTISRLMDEVVVAIDSPLAVGTSILDLRRPTGVRTTVESPE